MRKIRKGNDICVRWSIFNSGEEPYPLDGKNLKLYIKNRLGSWEFNNFTIEGNIITFYLLGKDQNALGTYSFVLVENEGETDMKTVDVVEPLMLVPHTYQEQEDDEEGVDIEYVDLSSMTAIGINGASAYEIAVQHGYKGTEEEWLASLKGEPGPQGPKGDTGEVTSQTIVNALGYSPVSPSLLGTEMNKKQNVISDLEDIRRGARLGSTAYQRPSTGIPRGAMDSSVQQSLNKADTAIQDISGKVDKIPGKGLSTNDYTNEEKAKLSGIEAGAEVNVNADWAAETGDAAILHKPDLSIYALDSDVNAIEALIPAQASTTNQLADKNFVNSSISTNTAEFQGTYNSVSDLSLTTSATHAQIATALASEVSSPDNNDYCFVQIPTSDSTPAEIASVERYKFNGTAWDFEFELNNSGYTAAQWAAINSGITSAHVTKINALPTASELSNDFDTKVDKVSGKGLSTNDYDNTEKAKAANGDTAYGWGNHANAGYALASALSGYLPLTGGTLTGNLNFNNAIIRWAPTTAMSTERFLGPHSSTSYDLAWYDGSGWRSVWHTGNDAKILLSRGSFASTTDADNLVHGVWFNNIGSATNHFPTGYGIIWSYDGNVGNSSYQNYYIPQFYMTSNRELMFRGKNSASGWGDWNFIAFTSSNVASATKLQTARTIWGQPFDGTANVTGNLTLTGNGLILNVNGNTLVGPHAGYVTICDGSTITDGWDTIVHGKDLYFNTGTGSDNANRMVIKSSGNVGIGTNFPAHKLDVNGIVKTNNSFRAADGTGTLRIGYWDSSNTRIENTGKPLLITSYSQPIKIGFSGDGDAIYLKDTNKYVGINNTDPQYRLDVNGTFNASGNTTIGGTFTVGTASVNKDTTLNGNLSVTGTINAQVERNTEISRTEEFHYQPIPVKHFNDAYKLDKIKGKSLAWNQLVQNGNFVDTSNWSVFDSTFTVSSNVAHIVTSKYQYGIGQNITLVSGHKYIGSCDVKSDGDFAYYLFNGITSPKITSEASTTFVHLAKIFTANASSTRLTLCSNEDDGTQVTMDVKNACFIDLTLLFGSGNEPTTVAEFESLYPELYYPYNAGQLISNDASEIETVGFNQWDEEVELGYIDPVNGQAVQRNDKIRFKNFMPVIGGATYYVYNKKNIQFWKVFYDANKNFLSYNQPLVNTTFTVPDNAKYMRCGFEQEQGTTYNHDICINLSDESRNGTYEPYWKRKIDLNLDSFKVKDKSGNIITVNGLKSAGSVYDEIVGNKYVKRVKSINLGGLNLVWVVDSGSGRVGVFYTHGITDMKAGTAQEEANLLCSRYINGTVGYVVDVAGHNMTIGAKLTGSAIQLFIQDASLDGYSSAQVNSALNGVTLNYELATPVEYQLVEPMMDSGWIDENGTMRAVYEDESEPHVLFKSDITYGVNAGHIIDKANEIIKSFSTNMTIIGETIQSLQSQVDSLSSYCNTLIEKIQDLETRIEIFESANNA